MRLSILLLLFFTACSVFQGTETAERSVDQFHASYDRTQFAKIYSAAHPDLKQVTAEPDFLGLMEGVHRKMGKIKATRRVGSGFNATASGTRVTLAYETEFERGTGVEQFVWHIRGDSALLVGYNINSPALLK